ncbi:hypothetical protein BDW02DRAFT_83460 [Decorospora gaudefroyi]|uniref:SUN domain-containing protein n=1 Tax=Decorospora gaudefroyi TaxID=184978 RepID=A0A6A5KSL2_9PLEO|nr:hypothetical protein BDW02DRAFT_83460 [Decorospora gaudefroyi]
MPTIGAPLRKWTLFLLLCGLSTSAVAEAANETAIAGSSATAHSGGTTQRKSAPAASQPSASPPCSAPRRHADTETTCPYRTINYITHTLPQQCAKTSWSAPGEAAAANGTSAEGGVVPGLQTSIHGIRQGITNAEESSVTSAVLSQREATGVAPSAAITSTAGAEPEPELETDSPFDNANFLSFEEWKKKNLAEVGQSPENVGQGRAAASNQPARRRPVNVNALDSLGDEGEISIDFSGFGTPEGDNVANSIQPGKQSTGSTKDTHGDGKVAPSSWALSKDAGKTCKERFNYASFDCAATVLKTNKQAKSSSSILVENKDSYMLNECSADNKFLIVELCDDILVDTIVLANYEFFSSMFRHFRVSVSDRYPVKMEKWRTLGTFEARNSREIQPFLITEPQIWARYLRVEFLTQFGNEYYCPLSVLRVHGTTMMEQFRREEEEARGIDDDDGDLEAEGVEVKMPAEDSGPLPPEEIPIEAVKNDSADAQRPVTTDNDVNHAASPTPLFKSVRIDQASTSSGASTATLEVPAGRSTDRPLDQNTANVSSVSSSSSFTANVKGGEPIVTIVDNTTSLDTPSITDNGEVMRLYRNASSTSIITSSPSLARNDSITSSAANATVSASSTSASAKAPGNSTAASPQTQGQSRGSSTQPNSPTPSTQESFFKSIHKRLLYLEANSTLSLQYIEEQSRALRDAFVKVEKRQLAKTEKFLDHLNSTVMLELKSFRNMYDQLWQSTVIELESMKERQKSEMGEIGQRLSLMADELVWQKRMAVVQSTLLLLCLGLVLFVRSGTLGTTQDVPIVQQLGNKYTRLFESSPPRSPPDTSGMARRRRTFRNMWKSDTSVGLSDHQSDGQTALSDAETDGLRSPGQSGYSPPTPSTPGTGRREQDTPSLRVNGINTAPLRQQENDPPTPTSESQAARIRVLETQSGPATPNGTRDSRPSWEEVDRAMDLLKAEELGHSPPKKGRERKKNKRSPLRRAQSSYDGTAGESPPGDDSEGLFAG